LKWNDPKSDKITLINEKIDDVKTQMIDNIDNIIARGEKLEKLSEQTNQLDQSALQFKKTARKVKNAFAARFVGLVLVLLFFPCFVSFILKYPI